MNEGGQIIRTVFGTSHKEAETISMRATKGNLEFTSPDEVRFHGKDGGKKFGDFEKKKEDKPLKVTKVEGPFDENGKKATIIKKGEFYTFKATPSRKPSNAEVKLMKWAIKYDNGKIKELVGFSAYNKLIDGKIIVTFKTSEDFEKAKVYAYFIKASEKVSVEINLKINQGGAFLFILTDELLPSGKLVRKVIVPPPAQIFDYFKSNQYEMFGMKPPNPFANITIGEHALGLNQSPYLSSSSLPHGAPNFNGTPQFIDINKAKAAGCKIYTTEEIVSDLKKLKEKAPTAEAKARLDKVINAVSNVEKEVLIKGEIPSNAIKSSTSMKLTKGLRVLNVIGIVITAYELEQATEKSIKQSSIKPITAETIRQVGGWGGAIAGAKIGAIGGAAVGIETGPGAILTGAVGAIIFGTAGYFGADWVADYIDEN